MAIRDEIYAFFETLDLELPDDLNDQTHLFDTGLLDSLALFNLLTWIEHRTGQSINPTVIDVRREWATIDHIVSFIEGPQGQSYPQSQRDTLVGTHSSPDDNYRVVKYRPEFKAQIANLQKGLWSPDVGLNIRYFEWLYERNPYASDSPLVYLAFCGDELVGMRGFWVSKWEIASRIESVLIADDLVIRDDHRNRGLFTRIMHAAFTDLADKGFTYAFNLSGSPINLLGSLTMGWKSVGLLDPMGTPAPGTRIRKYARSIIRNSPMIWRLGAASILYSKSEKAPFNLFDKAVNRRDHTDKVGIRFDTQPRLHEMADLANRQPHDGRIRQVRDFEFLRWRYENPLNEYRFLYAYSEKCDGYISISRSIASPTPIGRVTVADFEALDDEVFFDLLTVATEYIQGLYIWTATFSESRRSGLLDLEFAPTDQERTSHGAPCILVRCLSGETNWRINGKPLLDMNAWDIRMLYSMSA